MGISDITAKLFRPKANSATTSGELCDQGPLLTTLNLTHAPNDGAGSALSTGVTVGLALPSQNGPLTQNRLSTSKQINDYQNYQMQSAFEGTGRELGSRATAGSDLGGELKEETLWPHTVLGRNIPGGGHSWCQDPRRGRAWHRRCQKDKETGFRKLEGEPNKKKQSHLR